MTSRARFSFEDLDARAVARALGGEASGSPAEVYLRQHRGIQCQLPTTLGFLPAHEPHPPALIAAFGLAHELEPGVIAINEHAVMAVHLIKLAPDGRKLPDEPNKITIASPGDGPGAHPHRIAATGGEGRA